MTIIVTVHGTSAGDAEDEGQHWWQRNSDFQKRLSSWLDLTGVRIEPFHWGSGPNSEVARRAAGQELFKKLRQFEEFGESYLLIGHSHGGSVIYHALIEAAGKQHELPHLKQWITIGTPFISMRRKRLTFRRLNDIGKIAYIFMLMSIISLVSVPNIYVHGKEFFKSMFPMELLDVGVAGILIWSCLYPIVIYRILRLLEAQTRRRYSEATGRFLVDHFLSRWQSLRSRDDEAINVLRSTKPLKVSLFDRLVLTGPAKNFLVFFMILMFSMWLVLSLPLIGRDIGLTPAYFDQIYTTAGTQTIRPQYVGSEPDRSVSGVGVCFGTSLELAGLDCGFCRFASTLVGFRVHLRLARTSCATRHSVPVWNTGVLVAQHLDCQPAQE
jgi:hypothetical protein